MSETLDLIDGRSVLRIERRLAHPPEKVWRAITEPEQLAAWFPFEVEMRLAAGAPIRFVEPSGTAPATEGVITELDRPRVFAYRWADDHLRWELRPAPGGTLLIFTHTFDDRAGAASFAAGWQTCLAALDALLSGRAGEAPTVLMPEMDAAHERYVVAFGLADGVSVETPDGWRVRFERQLVRPIETVWAALAGSAPPAIGAPVPPALTAADVPAGTVTLVDAPTAVEYDWLASDRPVGRVRWELRTGTGQGARLVLTQTGPRELSAARTAALAAWRVRIERLAAQLCGTTRAGQA